MDESASTHRACRVVHGCERRKHKVTEHVSLAIVRLFLWGEGEEKKVQESTQRFRGAIPRTRGLTFLRSAPRRLPSSLKSGSALSERPYVFSSLDSTMSRTFSSVLMYASMARTSSR